MKLSAIALGTILGANIAWVFYTDMHLDPFALLLTVFTAAFVALVSLLSVL